APLPVSAADQAGDRLVDAVSDGRIVHGVQVDALYAVGDQVDNLLDGVGDAGVLHGGRVVAVAVHDTHKLFGQAGAAQRDHPLDLLAVGHRHDASLHRHGDARLAHPVEKAVKVVVVKEKLGDQVGSAGVHL